MITYTLTARINGSLQSSRFIYADECDIDEIILHAQSQAKPGVTIECEEYEDYRGQHDDDGRQD